MRRVDGPLVTVEPLAMDALASPPPPPPPPLPPLGTPPGSPPDSPPDSPRTDNAHNAPLCALSPSRSRGKTSGSASNYALDDSTTQTAASTATGGTACAPLDDGDDEFHDIALDATMGVVTKSIFKEKRSGFLSRLRDASSSMVKTKYAPSDAANPSVVLPASAPPPPRPRDLVPEFTREESEQIHRAMSGKHENVEIVLDEDEPIDVAIDQTSSMPPPVRSAQAESYRRDTPSGRRSNHESATRKNGFANDDDDDDSGVAPQVVIHSTESESESGFATLNPVINRSARGKRGSASSAITTGPAIGANPPVLISLPIDEEAPTSSEHLVLVVNALGATGLTKVEKFGTQSTLLEMRVCESTDDLASGASHLSFLRTALHKKGGSEAQWNQQFTTGLRSKTKQMLHVAVRTHSKLLVGEAMVSLANVSDTLYDQHFPIHPRSSEDRRECVGQVHLQLRIVQAAQLAPANSSGIPQKLNRSARRSPGPIPPVLRNGALMFKVPYHSHSLMGAAATKRQWIAVSGDSHGETVCITWCDPIDTTERSRRLDVCLITEVREGARTKAFERLLQNEPSSVARERDRCFSIISKTRTLDLVASSKEEALIWIESLRDLVFGSDSEDAGGADPSAKTIEDFRHSALVTRDSSTLSMMSTTAKKQQHQQWRSQIFECARREEVDFIASCLQDGCPVDLLETGTGDTLLMLACRLGDARLVELCLQWRAKNDPHPEFGETALQVAVNAGHADCLQLILKTAAESEMDSEIVNHIDSNNDAPLHVAARRGDLACMQLLLHHGADICVVEEFGRTPLHCAVLSGSLDCVAYLLDVGGDSVLNAGDHDGDTALHYAALAGVESIVKLLLESAADVQAANVHGESALELARREKHAGSEKLIAQYDHANVTVPAIRNEPASSLLMLHQKSEPLDNDQTTDAMDYGDDEEEFEDQDSESYIEPSNSPVRRGPIERVHSHDRGYDDDAEYYFPHSARSSTSSSRSTQPISPSARVREVLETHRQRTSLHRSAPVPTLHFHSARDDLRSRYALEPDYVLPTRQAFTERIDREQERFRAYHDHRHPGYVEYYRPYERESFPYGDDRGYSHSPIAFRNRSMSAHGYHGAHPYPARMGDTFDQWRDPSQYSPFARQRPGSADLTLQYRQHDAWREGYSHHTQIPVSVPTPVQSVPTELWDTYYSDQGYPYYVNRVTGESQWENPYEKTPLSPPMPVAPVAPHPVDDPASANATPTIPPDVQARIRHAAARELNLLEVQRDSSDSTHTVDMTQSSNALTISVSQVEELPADLPSSSCESPSSKYEFRTGMKLSIDVASPKRHDENRPVFIASPRARSPRKQANAREAETPDASFEKSTRASSPRGKSKNIQFIELKRANNLAMALASFKINDRNDQIVQALTTLDERIVNAELLVCLQRFFPTEDEAAQLRSYDGPIKSLGPAERFFFQLLQVPDIVQRIECFLYKLQFSRNYRSVYSKIQVAKRACRDLIENYSFVQALSEFFKKVNTKSLQAFRNDIRMFRTEYLPRVDEKLHSFHDDLRKAAELELLDVELQINRLVTGARTVQAFVDKTSPPKDQDVAAHDILHRFHAESRGKLTDLEGEYEALGQWEIKVLDLFSESKASCQLTSILECLCSMLDKPLCR